MFIVFLEQLAARADDADVLKLVFGNQIPPFFGSKARAASEYDEIALEFRDHCRKYLDKKAGKPVSFAEAKRTFKGRSEHPAKTIDRALEANGLDVPARRGSRKT